MEVSVYNTQTSLSINCDQIPTLAKLLLKEEEESPDALAIHLVSKEEISSLHERFFNDPTETDCISLPYDDSSEPGYRFLGEIFVCPEVALDYAAKHDKNLDDEVALYIIHGLLHLLGYDDIDKEDRQLMRKMETKHLSLWQKKKLSLVKNSASLLASHKTKLKELSCL